MRVCPVATFRRSLVGIFASFFVMACGPLNAGHAAEQAKVEAPALTTVAKLPAAPVMLGCFDGAGKEVRHGSAFRVAPDLLVTSAHVPALAQADGSLCTFRITGQPVSFVYVDAVSDVALARTQPSADPIFALRCDYAPNVGDGVISAGFGRSGGFLLTEGSVTDATIKTSLGEQAFQTDSHVEVGMSGGPTLDKFYQVIGVNMAVRPFSLDRAYSIIVPIATVCGQVERYRRGVSQVAGAKGS